MMPSPASPLSLPPTREQRARTTRILQVSAVFLAIVVAGCAGQESPRSELQPPTSAVPATSVAETPVLNTVSPAAGAQPSGPTTAAVSISGFTFAPANITIAAGSTVVWTNTDASPHTVTESSGLFDSGALQRDQRFERTFNTTGVFTYRCSFHTGMIGTITVS